jgi:hypothetical protein
MEIKMKTGVYANITKDEESKELALQTLKAEVARKASIANKRLARLEKNNLTNLPAYQMWLDYKGGVKFSVKGKDYNELQKELARVNAFLNAKTSLVREANKYLKEIAAMTGIKYKSVKELPALTKNFFVLASKIEQYLRNVEGSASAIGYQKIWEVINKYVKEENAELLKGVADMESAIPIIAEMIQIEHMDFYQVEIGSWIDV